VFEVFLCCSPEARQVAAQIAARLQCNAEATVVIDDGAGEGLAAKWEGGVSSAAILLLLSPDAVPAVASRASWQAVLDHITSNAEPPLGSLLVRDCGYPRLLERRNFFRWDNGAQAALRAVEAWVMRLHRLPRQRSFTPAHLPWFEGRHDELELLWETLVDRCGTAVVLQNEDAGGKTSLAQEFARQAGAHFRDVLWIACADRSPASIAAELAEQLGIDCGEGDASETFGRLAKVAGRHRVLLVLDDCPPDLALPWDPEGRASLLVTTRSAQVRAAQVIRIDNAAAVPLKIPENPVDLQLWQAMTVCRPSGFPLELAAEIAGIQPSDLAAACERLIQNRLVDPFDQTEGWLRLSESSIATTGGSLEDERRRHAELVRTTISRWAKNPAGCKRYMAEITRAFRWAVAADWPLACGLAQQGFSFLRAHGRVAEGVELLTALRDAADLRGDWQVSDNCDWELSWIRGVPYRGADQTATPGDQLGFDFAG